MLLRIKRENADARLQTERRLSGLGFKFQSSRLDLVRKVTMAMTGHRTIHSKKHSSFQKYRLFRTPPDRSENSRETVIARKFDYPETTIAWQLQQEKASGLKFFYSTKILFAFRNPRTVKAGSHVRQKYKRSISTTRRSTAREPDDVPFSNRLTLVLVSCRSTRTFSCVYAGAYVAVLKRSRIKTNGYTMKNRGDWWDISSGNCTPSGTSWSRTD